jgi:hypothetical protein
MKVQLEQALHLGAAAVILVSAFGLDPMVAAVSLAAIHMGMAIITGL